MNSGTHNESAVDDDIDLIVLSDLHLGRGQNPATRRHYALEAFFFDDDFLGFCRHITAQADKRSKPFKLILNGDTFDFLRIESDAPAGSSLRERRYGPALTPEVVTQLAREILAGHKKVVRGIAHVLLAGYEVVLLPGNHDLELQWAQVQDAVRDVIHAELIWHTGEAGEQQASKSLELLTFKPWFYHEPGRVWIEHGCQFDPENSFRYPLRTELANEPDSLHEAERDMPLGNFFQRYLYNDFGAITFIVPTARANQRYLKWFLLNRPRWLLHLIFSHAPFVFQMLRRLAKAAALAPRRKLRAGHQRELADLAQSSGLGDKLVQIDNLKARRADVVQATRTLSVEAAKAAGTALVVVLLATMLWFVGFLSINTIQAGFGVKALLFLSLNLLALVGSFAVLVYFVVRNPIAKDSEPLGRAGQRIADILDVSVVTLGHTHEEFIWPLERKGEGGGEGSAWYFNTGTWIAVFTHDVLLPRERVQYTYLRIRGHEGRLVHWSPERGKSLPVVLLESATHE